MLRTCPACQHLVIDAAMSCPYCGYAIGAVRKSGTTTAAPTDPAIGHLIAGKYQIVERIGEGGMGRVYRARHTALDKDVCIKMLRPSLMEDATIVSRFAREAKAASRLNHPNSIQILDFGQEESGVLYIAMELIAGKDLRKVLKEEFPLGDLRICHIIEQVLAALGEAHAQNVIHRDLKPENIMVEQRRGATDYVKVLDFGIAKLQDPEVPGLTRADVVCGTPLYMSPEQATGSPIDPRSDLYTVGVILYQLTTATLPFEGQNSMEVLTKHVSEIPIPPRNRRPDAVISPDMERLILRALEKDPSRRPQTAEEFRDELLLIGGWNRSPISVPPRLTPATDLRPSLPLPTTHMRAAVAAVSTPEAAVPQAVPKKHGRAVAFLGGGVALAAVAALMATSMARSSTPPAPAPAVVSMGAQPVAKPPDPPGRIETVEGAPARDTEAAKRFVEEADGDYEEAKFAAAVRAYRRAIRADDNYAPAYKGLYKAGSLAGDKTAARAGGAGYLKLNPNADDADVIRESLTRL